MQNLISNLTQFNNFQIIMLTAHVVIALILLIISTFAYRTAAVITSGFALVLAIGATMLFIFFSYQGNQAVKNHEYTVVRNQMTLEIEGKSDMIKSHKFAIDSEDDTHIYIKTSSLFGTDTYVIEKSELDSVNAN